METKVFKLQQALSKVNKMLNSSLLPDETFDLILNELKSLVDYDNGYIFFLNGDSLELKSLKSFGQKEYALSPPDDIGLITRNFIKDKKPYIKSVKRGSNSLVSESGINIDSDYSYITVPLTLRDTLFGLIILVKSELNHFEENDLYMAQALAGIAAYSVKDSELGEVFKMQLTALKNNIIDKTKAFEVIKAQNEKILEADKAKTEFLANMSHELRTPLNAIIGFSEALSLKLFGPLNEKQEEYVGDIHSSGVHLLGMVNDLLDIAKIEAEEMKLCINKFNAVQVAQESVNVIKGIADKKKILINLISKSEDIQIHADQQKYQQILYNLLSNAVKFSSENSQVDLELSSGKGILTVKVSDNGIGIDEKYHGKIFAKFQQVDSSYTRKYSSTGLGLTITKELIELHGGKVWIESKLNEGTTFTFELPLNT